MRRSLMNPGCCLHHEELWPEVTQHHLQLPVPAGAVLGLLVVEPWHPPPAGLPLHLLLNHPDKAVSF